MIKIILEYLPYLFMGIIGNTLLGVFHNVGQLKENFSFKKLFEGLQKAIIISLAFIITAVLFDKLVGVVNLGDIAINPDILIYSIILMYLGKIIVKIKDIFKLETTVELIEIVETKEEDINEEQEEG